MSERKKKIGKFVSKVDVLFVASGSEGGEATASPFAGAKYVVEHTQCVSRGRLIEEDKCIVYISDERTQVKMYSTGIH